MIGKERYTKESIDLAIQELLDLFKEHRPNIDQMLKSLQLLTDF